MPALNKQMHKQTNKQSAKRTAIIAAAVLSTLLISGCSSYDPVPVEKCPEVVRHAQKVLGSMAPAYNQMMSDCKGASDSERGCVMAATKTGKLAQCM